MPRPQWTVEQCRLYGRKGGSQRKGKKLKSDEWRAGWEAGYKTGRAERKRAGMTEQTKDQNECSLGSTAAANPQGQSPVAAWLPIETAPEVTGLVPFACLVAAESGHEDGTLVVGEAERDDDGAWWWANERGEYHASEITHRVRYWMPLPAPPMAEAHHGGVARDCTAEQTQKSHQP